MKSARGKTRCKLMWITTRKTTNNPNSPDNKTTCRTINEEGSAVSTETICPISNEGSTTDTAAAVLPTLTSTKTTY